MLFYFSPVEVQTMDLLIYATVRARTLTDLYKSNRKTLKMYCKRNGSFDKRYPYAVSVRSQQLTNQPSSLSRWLIKSYIKLELL